MDELISEQDAIPVVIDRWEINAVGLEEEILCEMCENPMHTDRGCDGMCSYDEGMYKRIIKVLNDRMKPLQPEKPKQANCEYCHTDRDGYVFPLEKNSHAFIDRDKIVLKANGWRGEAKIKYCPICGRRLADG